MRKIKVFRIDLGYCNDVRESDLCIGLVKELNNNILEIDYPNIIKTGKRIAKKIIISEESLFYYRQARIGEIIKAIIGKIKRERN